ncbi:translation machinery-associated protein 16 [Saxophila tyrrhenica]|uniref:Translation machinery-associated protein 16 n=1 Tax=Saxophila tyrrhenica TaxID=1690608 RepID=A0AAV9PJZ2_9PEZI|nr:translation machinery-associated protein 16 [Saxophila tyrrhenica]
MPSKLAKVHKQITKKKGDKIKSLHENSRDARRLRRAGARDDRVARVNAVRQKTNGLWLERVMFFQDRLPDTLHPLAVEDIKALTEDYLGRHSDELGELKAERRTGRPASTRQTLLEQQRTMELQEYESGLWMPNLQDEQTLVKLDAWKGDWVGLGVMRFIRVDKEGGVKESQFPPRGAS